MLVDLSGTSLEQAMAANGRCRCGGGGPVAGDADADSAHGAYAADESMLQELEQSQQLRCGAREQLEAAWALAKDGSRKERADDAQGRCNGEAGSRGGAAGARGVPHCAWRIWSHEREARGREGPPVWETRDMDQQGVSSCIGRY